MTLHAGPVLKGPVAANDIPTALTVIATCTKSLVCDDSWCECCYGCEVEPGPAAFLLATRMHTQHIACLFFSLSFLLWSLSPHARVFEKQRVHMAR